MPDAPEQEARQVDELRLARGSAEEAAAMAHPPATPDGTAAYGDDPDHVIDFFAPRSGTPAPLVVLLHGGAWRQAYDRVHVSPLAALFAGQGLAVASVEYRCGDLHRRSGRWPETFDDVAAAVEAAPALAVETLGSACVDVESVVIVGHSAGGHLALWAAARHRLAPGSRWHRSLPLPVRGIVALAPIADLSVALALGVCSDAVLQLLGGPESLEERRLEADPAELLPTGIPTVIVRGTADTVVPSSVIEGFMAAARRAGDTPRLVLVEDAGHFPLIDPAKDAARVVVYAVTQLARRPA